jgi:hypothetical protein
MAKQTRNVVTHGLSGKIGDLLVFRQVKGKTIVSNVPNHSQKVSDKQEAHRLRFQQAVIYAQAALASPTTGAVYQTAAKNGRQPFNVAVADFFNAPDVNHIDLKDYSGSVGDTITVSVSDDVSVQSVEVAIYHADGSLVESGAAVNKLGSLWVYTVTQDNTQTAGNKIIITASDLPGNIRQKETIVEK